MTRTWKELSEERKNLARARGEEIVRLREEGKTYKEIGTTIGLSGSWCYNLGRRHIAHRNFHKNYSLIKDWDEAVRAAYAVESLGDLRWARNHRAAIYDFCSSNNLTRRNFERRVVASLQRMFGTGYEEYLPPYEAIWKGEKDQ
jgi:hypothetical protein